MTDADAFLAAVRAEPDSDAPRLIYADWLEEHGDEAGRARAELIRVQCKLAAMPEKSTQRPAMVSKPFALVANADRLPEYGTFRWEFVPGLDSEEGRRLASREHELLRQHGRAWAEPLPTLFKAQKVGDLKISWRFERGFVGECRMSLADWYGEPC